MRNIKRQMAIILAVLLMLPVQPTLAELPSTSIGQEVDGSRLSKEEVPKGEDNSDEKDAPKDEDNSDDKETPKDEDNSDDKDAPKDEDNSDDKDAPKDEDNSDDKDAPKDEDNSDDKDASKDEDNSDDEDAPKDENNSDDDETPKDEDNLDDEDAPKDEDNSDDEDAPKDEDNSDDEDKSDDKNTSKDNDSLKDKDTTKDELKDKNTLDDDDEDEEEDEDFSEDEDLELATPSSATPVEKVTYNTGNYEISVVSQEDYFDYQQGDAYFEEDGSYTIDIPEANPFFPYEVQFTYDDEVTEEWFMTPEDSLEIGGYTFYVSAYFDDTVVTQMSLEIAGEEVIVYPEEKVFTKGAGIMPMSLLPLDERDLRVDLRDYTPVELTMVSIASLFTGESEVTEDDKIMWCYSYNDNYKISTLRDYIDMSSGSTWQMIVGEKSQLAADNIRYIVSPYTTRSSEWLIPDVFAQNSESMRNYVNIADCYYNGSDRLDIELYDDNIEEGAALYTSLSLNLEDFPTPFHDELKAFEGKFTSIAKAEAGTDITEQLFSNNMEQADAGYLINVEEEQWITLVSYKDGTATGYLVMELDVYLYEESEESTTGSVNMRIYNVTADGRTSVGYSNRNPTTDGITTRTMRLDLGYAANATYHLVFNYLKGGIQSDSDVTAAYLGQYTSIAEATAAGAYDIKATLFDDNAGHAADYSNGMTFTIFVGEDGAEQQEVYTYCIKTEERPLNGNTVVRFLGLNDNTGQEINDVYIVDEEEDSYGDYNYLTIFVNDSIDLTELAPIFAVQEGLNLYAEGSSSPEISGVSIHDFSNGPLQYTASAENKSNAKNYWLQIIPAEAGAGKLYINSLADKDAETREEDGVVYSIREVLIDRLHNRVHDILLANIGYSSIPNISVEVTSDVVELDEYWTLNGTDELSGLITFDDTVTSYGELPNLAKIRLKAKDGAEGQDVSGTLTIKSDTEVLMVLTLTGTVGDPGITTMEIPAAVKYVPYGTMIQNNNKYSWNTVSYRLSSGVLPEGMSVMENGELYGVPKESGEFTFTVRMTNSSSSFSSSTMTYTLVVAENTDANVDGATDSGYDVTQRVPDIALNSTSDHTFVSDGVYGEFVDIFLDGEKLTEGVDYTSESGSTRITVRNQTLKASNVTGTHTLGVEFRTGETKSLKRAAQNYRVTESTGSNNSRNSSSSSSTSYSKKGIVDAVNGIVTGSGTGYSQWQQDEFGWKLIYADKTIACGHMITLDNGNEAEQVLWEKVNGSWYAFGHDGYLKSGWIYDYQLGAWYYMSEENGMRSGWYNDLEDGYTYYIDPATGKLVAGWKQIDERWYYFNEVVPEPTWLFNEQTGTWYYNVLSRNKPHGAMYNNERTPDAYWVGSDGSWDGRNN